ncbi:MAG: DUF433 domain-containing protein [Alphaproteobacteria bacterium]|nr:DUF433 domain-containing protein [Alphaproteobacteria bacterium]
MTKPIGLRPHLSLSETLLLADVPEATVRKDIADSVLLPIRETVDKEPLFRWVDPFFLAAVYRNPALGRRLRRRALDRLEFCVAPPLRKVFLLNTDSPASLALFHRPSRMVSGERISLDEYFYLDFEAVREEVGPRVDLYARGLSRITENSAVIEDEAVFRDTRMSVRHIGQMAASGTPVADIICDYRYLGKKDIAFAVLYSQAHPLIERHLSIPGKARSGVQPG